MSNEILYRCYGPTSTHFASVCPHLRAELDDFLEDMILLGKQFGVTKAEAEALDLFTIMPVDLTQEEAFRYAEQATKLFFWSRGSRKCQTCGHVARGALAQCTAAEKKHFAIGAGDGHRGGLHDQH